MNRIHILHLLVSATITFQQSSAQTPYSCPSCDLHGKDFSGQNLTNANFSFANLDGANFTNATLNGAMFDNASLQNANFTNARCNPSTKGPANFSVANCTGAIFSGASLQSAVFAYAKTSGAHFDKSDVTNARLGLRRVFKDGAIITSSPAVNKNPARKKIQERNATNTVYVSTSGTDDASCGTADHPCQTIKAAVDKAPQNATIAVGYGEYAQLLLELNTHSLSFIGGLDDQDDWAPTIYQSSISSKDYALPIFLTGQGFGVRDDINISFSHFLLNSNTIRGGALGSCIFVVAPHTSVTLSDVNINSGQGGNGIPGFNGYDNYISALGPPQHPLANCGAGGIAAQDNKGRICCCGAFSWGGFAGGNGQTGSTNDRFAAYPGTGGGMGGASICIVVGNEAQLIIGDSVTVVASRGGNGGNGGTGYGSAGGGAGGNPGPSICIALDGPTAKMTGTPKCYIGQAGLPGKGGTSPTKNTDNNCFGHAGQDGLNNGLATDIQQY